MTKKSKTIDIKQLSYEALEAFWDVVVSRFPKPKFGDVSPECSIALSIAAEDSITEWVTVNAKIDHRAIKSSVIHELLTVAVVCRFVIGDRLATLREERANMRRSSNDTKDIAEQVRRYEALLRHCVDTINRTTKQALPARPESSSNSTSSLSKGQVNDRDD